uniref:Uncharacterized protein n=1 Tax=Fundulus heteroclitus TaxID=8078 RepID=A0A3Q2PYC4_FUNHE
EPASHQPSVAVHPAPTQRGFPVRHPSAFVSPAPNCFLPMTNHSTGMRLNTRLELVQILQRKQGFMEGLFFIFQRLRTSLCHWQRKVAPGCPQFAAYSCIISGVSQP